MDFIIITEGVSDELDATEILELVSLADGLSSWFREVPRKDEAVTLIRVSFRTEKRYFNRITN
jgi:hypothetical protein